MKRILFATLAGAIVAFLWSFASWVLLPWHQPSSFKNDALVSQTLKENAPEHGVYVLPKPGPQGPDAEALTEGPFIYAIVRPDKLNQPWNQPVAMAKSFAVQLTGALIIAIAIHRIRATRYISRASVGPAMGLFAGLIMTLQRWNWFELPQSHTIAEILDPFIAWTLAGLVIAAIIKTPKAKRIFS